MRALMWFRSDLRTGDNRALAQAARDAQRGVVAVFAICPKQWQSHDWGRPKADFVLRNVAALSEALQMRNIPLLIVRTPTFAELPRKLLALARKHACDALYFNEEYEVNERGRDEAVCVAFEQAGLAVHSFVDQVILDVGKLRTKQGGFYSVFTPFRRRWLEALEDAGGPHIAPTPRKQAELIVPPDDVSTKLPGLAGQAYADLWPAGSREARRRLSRFVENRIAEYDKNRDLAAIDGTSTLSPYLAAGVLSPRQCLQAAIEANPGRVDSGRQGIVTWIGELIWREFYRHVLIGFPRVCMSRPFQLQTEAVAWRDAPDEFATWCEGRTGFPIVDAGMRQLAATGWMHNRLRMITAMFLTKNLLIDWRCGERFFMQHLVDGDFASNNGGWQWSASTGTDAAPYFRIFNPISQSRKVDPDGVFIREYVPELADVDAPTIHEPYAKLTDAQSLDYPPPMCDLKQTRTRALQAFKAAR